MEAWQEGVRDRRGGIASLRGVLGEHSEAVEYDLLRLGQHIDDLGTPALSWRDLWVVVTCAQPDTATFKALNPDWQHTLEVEFLRSIEYTNRWDAVGADRRRHGGDPEAVEEEAPERPEAGAAAVGPRAQGRAEADRRVHRRDEQVPRLV